MQIERDININVSWDGTEYAMNITPIINALLKFLEKIFNAYLPEEVNEIVSE